MERVHLFSFAVSIVVIAIFKPSSAVSVTPNTVASHEYFASNQIGPINNTRKGEYGLSPINIYKLKTVAKIRQGSLTPVQSLCSGNFSEISLPLAINFWAVPDGTLKIRKRHRVRIKGTSLVASSPYLQRLPNWKRAYIHTQSTVGSIWALVKEETQKPSYILSSRTPRSEEVASRGEDLAESHWRSLFRRQEYFELYNDSITSAAQLPKIELNFYEEIRGSLLILLSIC